MTNVIEQLLELRPPQRPGRRPRGFLAKLLPDPLRSLEEWARYAGDDLATLTPRERAVERNRLMVAIAYIDDPALVPAWCWRRLKLLGPAPVRPAVTDVRHEPARAPDGVIAMEVLVDESS